MKEIKKFYFPSFEEWDRNNRNYECTMGDYQVKIQESSFNIKCIPHIVYKFVLVEKSDIKHIIFMKTYTYKFDQEENLKQWYDFTIKTFELFWKRYVQDFDSLTSNINDTTKPDTIEINKLLGIIDSFHTDYIRKCDLLNKIIKETNE